MILRNIEFHISPDQKSIMYLLKGEQKSRLLTTEDGQFCRYILSNFEIQYPKAVKRAKEIYKDATFPLFHSVRRLLKCNCGIFDHILDIDEFGIIHTEFVFCPLRGECMEEGVICMPERETCLLPREKEVGKLVSQGKSNEEIAQMLFVSLATVKSHIANSMRKLNVKNRTELGVYMSRI